MKEKVSLFEGKSLIGRWADFFDAHAAPEIVLGITAREKFTIRFHDTVLTGLDGLKEHDRLKSVFYDEQHLYYNFQIEESTPHLVLQTQMVWDTRRRTEGNGSDDHLISDLRHRWTFTYLSDTGEPVILTHELLELSYRDGFSPSTADTGRLHTDPSRVKMGR